MITNRYRDNMVTSYFTSKRKKKRSKKKNVNI